MNMVHIDFETRSTVDLKKCGLHNYATDSSTEILCLAYAFDDSEVHLWKQGDAIPADLISHVSEGRTIVAHNAHFEIEIWNSICHLRYGWPAIDIEQIYCTMAMAYAMALPAKLENLAPALGLSIEKDSAGGRIMLQLSKPKDIVDGEIIWWNRATYAEKYERVYAYCKQDVEVEREVHKRMMELSPSERGLWLLDYKINKRGIQVDIESIKSAMKIIDSEKIRLDNDMKKITNNAVSTCTASGQLKDWLIANEVYTTSVSKTDVTELLKSEIPASVRAALLLRQEAAKASTAKLSAMFDRANVDGRIRGTTQYHGASTGRWSGRGVQVHNLPRPQITQEKIDSIFRLINEPTASAQIEMLYGQPTTILSDCLRGFITAKKNHSLIACDYSAIEARVLAWLAGEEKILEVFRGHGKIYEVQASEIFKVNLEDVSKEQRQIGKVAILALGYQGGVGAFQSMAKNYNVKVSDANADEIKKAWRNANPKIVNYWYSLEHAAKEAIRNPGKTFTANTVKYKVSGTFLWCLLPSNRAICYPYPKLETLLTPWKEEKETISYMAENATSRKWERSKAYGGLLAENVTQAVARDILAEAIVRLEANKYTVVMYVHDEIVCEIPKLFGSVEEMEKIMCELPEWAKGLPISAEGWLKKRYQK